MRYDCKGFDSPAKRSNSDKSKKDYMLHSAILMIITFSLLVPVIICLICDLTIGSNLNSFYMALIALMIFASLTIVPLAARRKKHVWSVITYVLSIISLIVTIILLC